MSGGNMSRGEMSYTLFDGYLTNTTLQYNFISELAFQVLCYVTWTEKFEQKFRLRIALLFKGVCLTYRGVCI